MSEPKLNELARRVEALERQFQSQVQRLSAVEAGMWLESEDGAVLIRSEALVPLVSEPMALFDQVRYLALAWSSAGNRIGVQDESGRPIEAEQGLAPVWAELSEAMRQ